MTEIKGWKFLFTALFALSVTFLHGQKNLQKNPHVTYDVSKNESGWEIKYKFQDQFFNLQTYTLEIPYQPTRQMIDKFGIPLWMFEPYVDSEANRLERQKLLSDGLFLLRNNTIEVDKSAVLTYYSQTFCKPIAEMIVRSLSDYGKDNRLNRIEMAMRFVQDIPYGVPTYEDENRHYGGVSPPPKLLLDGYGDCDSKVLLFAGIMIYLIPGEDIIFLNQSDHVLSAIKDEPKNHQTFVRFRGDKYLIAETAGPGKRLLGEKGNYFRNKFEPEVLRMDFPEVIPTGDNKQGLVNYSSETSSGNVLILTNHSTREFRFQLSLDKKRWEPYFINGNQSARMNFKKHETVFIRFRDRNSSYMVYEVETGGIYNLDYNDRKRKWSINL